MQYHVCRKAMVPYTAEQMYALVYDIASYPEFVPWCVQGYVASEDKEEVCGVLVFARFGMHYTLKTRNICTKPVKIELNLMEGPLDHLYGTWQFNAVAGGCEVVLDLDFKLRSYGLDLVFNNMFDNLTERLVSVFVQRAEQVYIKSS